MNFRKRIISVILSCLMIVTSCGAFASGETADFTLSDIEVNGGGIAGFDPTVTEYEVLLPYIYKTNDFNTIEMPEVTASTSDKTLEAEVSLPLEAIDGEKIYIYVKDAGEEVKNTYTLTIKTVGKNLFPDGGFETETADKYTIGEVQSSYGYLDFAIVDDASGAGNKVLAGNGSMVGGNGPGLLWYTGTVGDKTGIWLSKDKTYLSSFMAKLNPDSPNEIAGFYNVVGDGKKNSDGKRFKSYNAYLNSEGESIAYNKITLTDSWEQYTGIVNQTDSAGTDIDRRVGIHLGSTRNYNHKVDGVETTRPENDVYFLYDEMFLGELVIAKAELTDDEGKTEKSIAKPNENISISLSEVAFSNQFGNTAGLEGTEVSFALVSAPEEGVSFDEESKTITVTKDAEPGALIVEATLVPKYEGAVQSAVKARYKLNIEPEDSDYLPKAKDVAASGTVKDGLVLSADYRFWSYDSAEGGSLYQWYYSENEKGPFLSIDEANAKEYTVEKEYEDYYICFGVTPKDTENRTGKEVKSNVLRQPTAPEALNVFIAGDTSAGNVITGKYTFSDPNGDSEATSTFRWLISDSENGEFSPISGADSINYSVKQEDMGKYLKFEVTPVSEVAPFSEKAYLSKAYLCAPASVLYALSDIEVNGGGIEGFKGDKLSYEIVVPYVYKENDFNGFNKPVVSAEAVKDDAKISVRYPESISDGAQIFIDVLDSDSQVKNTYTLTIKTAGKNLFPDGGFETESRSAYIVGDNGPLKWDIVADDTGAGKQVLKANGSPDSNGFKPVLFYNSMIGDRRGVYLEANKTYINGFMVKRDPERANENDVFEPLVQSGNKTFESDSKYLRRSYSGEYYTQDSMPAGTTIALTDTWKKYIALVSAPDRETRVGASMGSDDHSILTYFLYDEMYLGELVIADVKVSDQDGETSKSMIVPSSDTSVYLEAAANNQYGNPLGLDKSVAPITFEMIKAPEVGVTFDAENNKIDISPDAEPGEVIVEATVKPDFSGAVQTSVKKRYKLILTPKASNYIPKAKNVTAEGIVRKGETLTAGYTFWSYDSNEGTSLYQWYASNSEDGVYSKIPGATEITYTVDAANEENYIYCEITPVDSTGRRGAPVKSRVLLKPTAPTAKNVLVSGDMIVGKTITASYEYFDANEDAEGTSTFRWLRQSGSKYEQIAGAEGMSYTLTEEDIDCYLKFEVTPKSTVYPENGEAVLSEAYFGPARAKIKELEINDLGGGVYTAAYVYKHPHNYSEGKTQFNWYLDGDLVGTDMKIKLDKGDYGLLELEVIPVCSEKPYEGESALADLKIKKSGGSSGGGGGGGGGISLPKNQYNNGTGIVPVPEKPVEEVKEEQIDENKHWASDAIDFVLKNNIMKMPRENDFANDELVTRAEFVSYIVRAIGKEPVSYKHIFGDVLGTDQYADYIQAAVEIGMISEDVNFYPERPVSREEICKILLFAVGEESTSEDDATPEFTSLSDSQHVAQWAVGFVRKAMKVGLMKGMGDGSFAPKGNVTRAQTAVLVMRTSEYSK